MSIERLKMELELDYAQKKLKYDMEAELLKIKRDEFYRQNPDFPYKSMYMQVTAPPMKVTIKTIF